MEPHPLHRGKPCGAAVHGQAALFEIRDYGLAPADSEEPSLLPGPSAQLGGGRDQDLFGHLPRRFALLDAPCRRNPRHYCAASLSDSTEVLRE